MSGGQFDYVQHRIDGVADDIDDIIASNHDEDDFEISYGFSPETIEKFKEAARATRLAATMIQRVDWLVSGDDGEESFHRRWKEEMEKLDDRTDI